MVFQFSCGNKKRITKSPTNTEETTSKKKRILDKYSEIVKEPVYNEALYSFIDAWIGTPYKYAGKDKSGVDCSNFTCILLKNVFSFPDNYYLPSGKLSEKSMRLSENELQEGDLVFFSINKNSKISHVGVYLTNKRFVHASTSKGVMINSLEESYYKSRISHFGRMKP